LGQRSPYLLRLAALTARITEVPFTRWTRAATQIVVRCTGDFAARLDLDLDLVIFGELSK
jgi:hypothetical protein